MKRLLPALLCLVALFSLGGCFGKGGESYFYYDLANEPKSLDPQYAGDSASLLLVNNLYDGLFRKSEEGKAEPALAESYSLSVDKRTYTFQLRKDGKWENGDPVTAHDFVFAFTRLLSPGSSAPYASDFYNIQNGKAYFEGQADRNELGVKALDDYTLVITLNSPDSAFIESLTTAAAMPCHESFFQGTGGQYGLEEKTILTNGAFTLSKWTHREKLIIKKNTHSYRANSVQTASVVFTIGSTADEAVDRFLKEKTDLVSFPHDALGKIKEAKATVLHSADTVWLIGFNQRSVPNKAGEETNVLLNQKLRLAFAYATRRESITGLLPEYLSLTGELVPPAITMDGEAFTADGGNTGTYDPEKARSYLEGAYGELGISKLPKLTIICPSDGPHATLFGYLQQVWQKDLTAYVNLKVLDAKEYATALASGDFDMAIFSLQAGQNSPRSILSQFTANGTTNYCNYSLELDLPTSASSVGELKSTYVAAQSAVLGGGYAIPLYFESSYYALAKDVTHLQFDPLGGQVDFSTGVKK